MLRVKILCTIGPASREPEMLTQMIKAGMNVARLNMSHGTHEYHSETIRRVRAVSEKLQQSVAILVDLQGPKLRVGKMQEGGVPLNEGESLVLTNEDVVGVPGRVPIQYKKLPSIVRPGEHILIDDGLLEVEVVETNKTEIHTRVVIGGTLEDNKGMNLPDASLDIPALTDKDREDVVFGLEHQADWIALSFVRTASEVIELKSLIQRISAFGRSTPVISKIEKPEAVRNIDAIIDASDGIMVARGDLGIETSAKDVPMTQKMIISKCLAAATPVITATQMLDSMIRNPRPTRAEASDVANAVLDGSDAIMLSGETATGAYPLESVQTMAEIAEEAERVSAEQNLGIVYEQPEIFTTSGAICHATVQTAMHVDAKAIIAPTMSGATAKLISGFRPHVPVVAVTPNPVVQRQLCLYWGTYPLLSKHKSSTDEVIADAIRVAQRNGYAGEGDTIVLTAGVVGHVRSATNLITVRTIERVIARGSGIGGSEIGGRLVRVELPVNGDGSLLDNTYGLDELLEKYKLGPEDIIFADGLDHHYTPLLKLAGGLITRDKGLDSYGAIAALEMDIPAVIGVEGNLDKLVDGTKIILDAARGRVSEWD